MPIIRFGLTALGIQQVNLSLKHGRSSPRLRGQPLHRSYLIELPLATPTIMAGLNQTIMMALSMVVIVFNDCSGAKGSAIEVLRAQWAVWTRGRQLSADWGLLSSPSFLIACPRDWGKPSANAVTAIGGKQDRWAFCCAPSAKGVNINCHELNQHPPMGELPTETTNVLFSRYLSQPKSVHAKYFKNTLTEKISLCL